jgi:flagellar hook protein FlgE
MSIGSFSAGLSGLNANAAYLSVIGNNLANINTVGFKASSFSFSDLVSQTIASTSANPSQVGLGVVAGAITPTFSQGSIESTRETTNMAIQGNGFFIVKTPDGNFFTRAGDFTFNADGFLVNPEGHFVQGYTQRDPATGEIITTGSPTNIQIPPGKLEAPTATTLFRTVTNLDANALNASTFTSVVDVFDSLGDTHAITITYTKTGVGAWSYAVTTAGAEVTGGTPGTPFSLATGTMTFDAGGALITVNGAAPADVAITTPTWINGAAANALVWDISDPNAVLSHSGFAQASATSSSTTSGQPAGRVSNISVDPDGTIQGTLNPGQTIVMARVALASFNNPKGLAKIGSNLFIPNQSAGDANVGTAGTGGRGTLFGSALEQSNVDMAQQFTQMILAQRGYQANSRAITTSDELLIETLNLKR